MISIPGTLKHVATVIGDADVLIALAKFDDALHVQASLVLAAIAEIEINIVFPNTAFAEAITTLQRKYSNPQLADFIAKQFLERAFTIEYVDHKIMTEAMKIYNPYQSKKKTVFDAIVAATAKQLDTKTIFSFDSWYTTLGFTLISDLLPKTTRT